MRKEPPIKIGAPGLDVGRIVAEIQAAADRKMAEGAYCDVVVARAERTNLANLRDSEEFLSFYLTCLRESAFVDISDFEIHERRRFLGGLLVGLKRMIWKALKFYTYRLWSQQNQANGLLVTAIEGLQEQAGVRAAKLEARIMALEKRAGADEKA